MKFLVASLNFLILGTDRILVSSFNASNCERYGASPVEKILKDQATFLTSGFNVIMSNNERFQLMHELLPTKKYFEFGCGGSTILASRMITTFNLSLSVTSIDSSSSWVSKMKEDLVLSKLERVGQFSVHGVYIGELGDWGFPKDSTNISLWPSYCESIWKYGRDAELVLVDGRFRVACALHAVLLSYTPPDTNLTTLFANYSSVRPESSPTNNVIATKSKRRTRATPRKMKIMVHDFQRQQHHRVLHYTNVLSCVDTLVVLQPKKAVNLQKLIADILTFQTKPDT